MNTAIPMMPVNQFLRRLHDFRQPVRRGPWRRWRRLLAILYHPLTAVGVYGYFNHLSATLILGVVALLYMPAFDDMPGSSFRFGWLAFTAIALFLIAPLKIVIYTALVCAVCCYRESFFRRVPMTTLFILALLTPLAGYFGDTFSFPIRMELTHLAGRLLLLTGNPVAVEGNTITWRQHLFSVDPACMGLHMLITSLLAALLVINYYQRALNRRVSFLLIAALLLLTIALNIIANLVRIVCLVVLLILPDNPLHGLFGILVLGVYVLLPLLPMIRYAIRRYGHPVLPANGSPGIVRSRWVLAGNILVAIGMLVLTVLQCLKKDGPQHPPGATIPGYTLRVLPNSILQLDNPRSMVYIKPIPGFYYTDHTPSICWEGSGYTFTTLRVSTFAGIPVFEGFLEKGREKLYTAWWYDNGARQTINPFDWRWDCFRGGAPYAVVNVTSATRPQLEMEIVRILKIHPFLPLLGRPHD